VFDEQTIKDDTLGMLTDLGQPNDILALIGPSMFTSLLENIVLRHISVIDYDLMISS
jgi:hypothetical protein